MLGVHNEGVDAREGDEGELGEGEVPDRVRRASMVGTALRVLTI